MGEGAQAEALTSTLPLGLPSRGSKPLMPPLCPSSSPSQALCSVGWPLPPGSCSKSVGAWGLKLHFLRTHMAPPKPQGDPWKIPALL